MKEEAQNMCCSILSKLSFSCFALQILLAELVENARVMVDEPVHIQNVWIDFCQLSCQRESKISSGVVWLVTYLAMSLFCLKAIEHPVRTNQIPRQIPEQSFYTKPLPGIIMGGILPFGCIFIQLFFILNSIWYVNCNLNFTFCVIIGCSF